MKYKTKLKLFWWISGSWFNELKYSKFFDEVWDKENLL